MKLAVCVMHAAFLPGRRRSLKVLLDQLGAAAYVEHDNIGEGAWTIARRCWEAGLALEADWIIVLNDDAIPCDDFHDVAFNALRERSLRDPVCFYTAHPKAGEVKGVRGAWYTTHDDLVGVGCALSRESVVEFLAWVDANPKVADFSDDGRINLWAMATGRLIYTTRPSLVDHRLPNESSVGTKEGHARTAVVPPEPGMTVYRWGPELVNPKPYIQHLGRARAGNQWELIHRSEVVDATLIERAYEVQRHGKPVSERPHVFIAMPAYVMPEVAVRASVEHIMADLEANGIKATYFESPGDSLVTRGRHGLMHEFLCSPATHLLQWDADIECQDPTAVRKMVQTGHDVVGGAYPWRDGSGRVVANPTMDTMKSHSVTVDYERKCIPVSEVGTGFLLTSRKCIVDLCARHPELMYMADIEPYVGAPMWALFDAYLEMREGGRRRYASEDWRFCQLAREAGYGVHVYYPPVFRHWGKTAHQGHIVRAWGLDGSTDAPG